MAVIVKKLQLSQSRLINLNQHCLKLPACPNLLVHHVNKSVLYRPPRPLHR